MGRKCKDAIGAILSALTFLIVEVIQILEIVPSYQEKPFEAVCNVVIFVIAVVCFFCIGLPSKEHSEGHLESLLGNLAISLIAFVMNIVAFDHPIRWGQIMADLKIWHLFWIVGAIVQLAFLSKWVENMLSQVGRALAWVQNTVKLVAETITEIAENLKKCDKKTFAIIIAGSALWGFWFSDQVNSRSVQDVLSDTDFLWISVMLWIVVVFVGLMIYIMPSLFQKANDTINKKDGKWVLFIVAIIVILVVSYKFLPILAVVLKNIITLSALPVGLLLVILKLTKEVTRPGTEQDNNLSRQDEFRPSDLKFVMISFIWAPLTAIFLVTVFFFGGWNILNTQDPAELTTWLNLLEATVNAVNSLSELFI